MLKIKKGDTVKILIGKDKGRQGQVEVVLPKKRQVIIPGINVYKKHVKKDLARDGKGGIYELPRAIDLAKVALVCPQCKKPARVGFKREKGQKLRVCKKCHKLIDAKTKKESEKKK